MQSSDLKKVGEYVQKFNDLTGQSLPLGEIYQSSGLSVHVSKHHPNDTGNIARIPDIIASPDYIGKHPKEPNSVELVKVYEDNVMVCVKLDMKKSYYYVASVFPIHDGKLQNRLSSGRLKKY